jgi:Cu+-exporting ATPase
MHAEQMTGSSELPALARVPASQLTVTGMTCNNCARHVTDAIQSISGVRNAVVNLESGRASVHWVAGAEPDLAAVVRAIKAEGFGAKASDAAALSDDHSHRKLADWQLTLWVGILGTAPLMIGEWVFNLGMTPWFQWFSFALAGVVQLFAGARFYRGAWAQLKVGSSNMDTLVALGSTTAFAYSTWALLAGPGGHVYFMEAAAIITLISLGHWTESRVSARASSTLSRLLTLAPQTARKLVLSPGAQEIEVPVAGLKIDDRVALRPGDRIPTDGTVMEGNSAVDESSLTGESLPVDKLPGNPVYAGTVNSNGRLVMRVTAVGEETALAHIIAAVQRAQTSRANIQRLGDRVSSVFVPVVVTIAVLTGLWWGLAPGSARQTHDWLAQFLWHAHVPPTALAAMSFIASAVLIVACPCAMGLATPAAIMAGSNAAAQRGILIRDGVALEKAGEITAVIFDKTGTLTAGKPVVTRFQEVQPRTAAPSVTGLAAALARHSAHPVSAAIASAGSGGADVVDWQEISGAGVQGKVNLGNHERRMVRLGSLIWLRDSGVNLAPGESFITESSARGATVVGLAIENSLSGLFAVTDTIKTGAAGVVAQLHRQGLKTFLVTGDNRLTAAIIAKQAGISPERVTAEVRPEQKAEFVKQLQSQGERVAFVGDGINDAPALEQADLGIAVCRASDVAREAADIILLNSEIEAVPESLGLARATLRTIKQNLFWAFFYNALGIPLAALGFMSPILCAAAMGFSDLIVIGNALRLRKWKLRAEPEPRPVRS